MSKKKKKVMVYKMPKAQDGMQMAEGAPQEQGGGQDQQMQQLAMQVQQMLEQGADPAQVVAELVQGGVPPQVVAQILVGLGMPQEQVMPMIEQVMQQMQGAQQQGPPQEGMPPEAMGAPQGQPMMQDGGQAQAQQQAMMEQYIMVFAAMNQVDPQQVAQAIQEGQLDMAQLQQAVESPEGQEVMAQMQQMAMQQQGMSPQEQMMQQVAKRGGTVPPGYHRMPDGSIMADSAHMDDGGQITELMMGAINPTKDDFLSLKKRMLKEMKAGGTTKGFDSNSTKSYVQNLQGAVANHVSKNMRIAMLNQQFDKVMKEFDSLPTASLGLEWKEALKQKGYTEDQYNTDSNIQKEVDDFLGQSRTDAIAAYQGKSYDDIKAEYDAGTLTAGDFTELVGKYYPDKAGNKSNTNSETDGKVSEESINQGDDDKDDKSFDEKFRERMQHYYPGWGPENYSLSGKYMGNRFDKTGMGLFLSGFGKKRGTGDYRIVGHGDLKGAGIEEINKKMADIVANPEKYPEFRQTAGYLNRRGKIKKRPGLFGRPETVQFDYVERVPGATDGETADKEEVANQSSLSPAGPDAPEGTMTYTDPITGEQSSVSPEEAERIRQQESGQNWQDFQVDPRWSIPEAENTTSDVAQEDTWRQMMEQKIAAGEATGKERRAYKKYMRDAKKAAPETVGYDDIDVQEEKDWAEIDALDDEIRIDDLTELEQSGNLSKDEKNELKKLRKKYPDYKANQPKQLSYTDQIDQDYIDAEETFDGPVTEAQLRQRVIDIEDAGGIDAYRNQQIQQQLERQRAFEQGIYDNTNADSYGYRDRLRKIGELHEQGVDLTDSNTAFPTRYSINRAPFDNRQVYEFGQKMHGGLVSNPGRPIWDFKQMKWSSPKPAQSLLFAQVGLETLPVQKLPEVELDHELMGYGPQGQSVPRNKQSGWRVTEDQVREWDGDAIATGLYQGIDTLGNFLQNVKDTPTSLEQQKETQKSVQVMDPPEGPGLLGPYTQWGDFYGAGAPKRAGTGSDPEASNFTSGFNYKTGIGYSDARPIFVKNGGLVMAQLGLQVGDELELTENEIMELAKYGYEVTRM